MTMKLQAIMVATVSFMFMGCSVKEALNSPIDANTAATIAISKGDFQCRRHRPGLVSIYEFPKGTKLGIANLEGYLAKSQYSDTRYALPKDTVAVPFYTEWSNRSLSILIYPNGKSASAHGYVCFPEDRLCKELDNMDCDMLEGGNFDIKEQHK